MSTEDEIYSEFFSALEQSEIFPDALIEELRTLKEEGTIGSKDRIREAISKELDDANND
jgi:hypothetical protein